MINVGKGAAIGIVVALALGVVIGYFLIPMIFPLQATDSRQTYFIDTAESCDINTTKGAIPGLGINFTTQAGDIVVIEFTCSIGYIPSTSTTTHQLVEVELFIDNIWTPSSYYQDTSDSTDNYMESFTFRHVRTTLDPGAHTVVVRIRYVGSVLVIGMDIPVLTVEIL